VDRIAGRVAWRGLVLAGLAALMLVPVALGGTPAAHPAKGPTRADLVALRRKAALLETELSLARSRKPYLVVDAETKRLRYGLLGMTMRDLTAQEIDIDGLRLAGEGGVPGPLSLAGIVTLQEKDKDPRLSPLTPEQIEAGAADENVADALPPESPADYALTFKQPIVVRIQGGPGKTTVVSRAFSWWPSAWFKRKGGGVDVALRVVVHLDETTAKEVYRSLIPGERLVIVPPAGALLPDAGQETPRSVRPGRAAKPPSLQPGQPPAGVPFRIPPPVAQSPGEGAAAANGSAPAPAENEAGVPSSPPAAERPSATPAEAAPAPTPPVDSPQGAPPS
jgi:hypothetical protein